MNTLGQGSLGISLNNHIISEMSCIAPSEIHQRNSHPCIYSSCPTPALRPFGSQSTWVWLGTIYLVSMDRIWWVLIICNFQLKKSSLLSNANKMNSSCLDADSNYKKLMRPSGQLVQRTWSETKIHASDELQPAVSQRSDTGDFRKPRQKRGEGWENWEIKEWQKACNLKKRAV